MSNDKKTLQNILNYFDEDEEEEENEEEIQKKESNCFC